jgi:hypothetical protein
VGEESRGGGDLWRPIGAAVQGGGRSGLWRSVEAERELGSLGHSGARLGGPLGSLVEVGRGGGRAQRAATRCGSSVERTMNCLNPVKKCEIGNERFLNPAISSVTHQQPINICHICTYLASASTLSCMVKNFKIIYLTYMISILNFIFTFVFYLMK